MARIKELQEHIHAGFIDHVKTRRGDRLNTEMELFDGSVWVGDEAMPTGLIDGVGHLVPKMKEVFGDKVRFRPYVQKRPLLSRLGASLIGDAMVEIEDRAAFARYGL